MTIWGRDGRYSRDQRIGINMIATPPIVAKRSAVARSTGGANALSVACAVTNFEPIKIESEWLGINPN